MGGLAVFMDAANGANFAVVPHVHPFANGILSGIIGATGNLGGIIFAIIFRYNGKDYAKVIWIIGAISIGVNVAVGWIRPVPEPDWWAVSCLPELFSFLRFYLMSERACALR